MPGARRAPLLTCLGELLVDFLPIEADGATTGFRMHAGGSLLNVALAAARLGQPVALAGKAGRDLFGRFLRATVEREGVDTRWLLDADAPSTLAFVATERGEPSFAFYGDGAADTLLAPAEVPEALVAETAILHVGSIALLRGTTPDAVEAACGRLRGRALLSLDPNVRPGLVRDEPAYRARLDRLLAQVDVVKVSDADLAWLVPGRGLADAARELLARGPRARRRDARARGRRRVPCGGAGASTRVDGTASSGPLPSSSSPCPPTLWPSRTRSARATRSTPACSPGWPSSAPRRAPRSPP